MGLASRRRPAKLAAKLKQVRISLNLSQTEMVKNWVWKMKWNVKGFQNMKEASSNRLSTFFMRMRKPLIFIWRYLLMTK